MGKSDKKKSGKTKSGKKSAPAGGQQQQQQQDAKQSKQPLSDEEKSRKIEKNKNAIEAIINMLRSIPPDHISHATREDLIQIHNLAKGITKRYKKSDASGGGGAGGGGGAANNAQQGEFKLNDVKPAFADIFSVCDDGQS